MTNKFNANLANGVEPLIHNASTYRNWGCRCEKCRKAHSFHILMSRYARAERLRDDPSLAPHGVCTTYENWMCRCAPCTAAHTEVRGDYQKKKRAREKAGD